MRNPVLFLTVISLVLLTTVNCHKKNSTEPEQTKETPTVQNDFKVEVEYTTEQVTLVLFSYGYANSVWQTLSENVQSFECNAGETINSITIDVSDEDEIIVIWELHDIVFNCKVDGSSCSRSWYSQGQICEYFACYYDVGTIKETISISITLIGEMPELNATVPVLTTADIGLITQTTARCGGTITSDGGGTVTTRGVCWSTDQTPTVSDNKTNDGTGEDTFTSDIAGLIPGTTYYVRAYATNIAGTGYGSVMSFTTEEPKVPVLTTADIGLITQTTARCGGTITSDGGGTVTTRGVCWSTDQTPTVSDNKTNDGKGAGTFTSDIAGLIPGTTYYVRAYATNIAGTGYGSVMSFTTEEPKVPVLTTADIGLITQTTARCGGTITSDGGGTITTCGVCWSTDQKPTVSDNKTNDDTGAGTFTSDIAGLIPETTYYVRAYATNIAGTGYGSAKSFTTRGTVTDIDGNVYQTVKIGNQWWMAANLKATHYRNGDEIPNVTGAVDWKNLTTGAYCNYDNNADYGTTYGRLYNWYAVNDSRNIAPQGWHVPTDAQWQTLIDYLGGGNVAGGKMKETETTHWVSPNRGATNESGFSALLGGYRNGYYFYDMGNEAKFWSSTASMSTHAFYRALYNSNSYVMRLDFYKSCGHSVRCIRD